MDKYNSFGGILMRSKKFFNLIISMVIIFSMLSGSCFAITDQKNSNINKYGNSSGNVVNGSLLTKQGDYIYCIEPRSTDASGFYKMKADLSGKTKISNDDAYQLGVVGDWIYYINADDHFKLYKIKSDGSGRKKLSDDTFVYELSVVGDWIYYTADNTDLYRIKTDGSSRKLLSSIKKTGIFITGDWIYYWDGGYICRIKTDGTKKSKIYKCTAGSINVVGDWIYFDEDWNKLSKVKVDGTGKKVLYNKQINGLNVIGDWIYFGQYQGIYKMKTDGGSLQQIYKGYPGNGISIIDNKIYFIETENQYVFYRMNFDGSKSERLDGFKVQTISLPEEKNGEENYIGNSNGNINNRGLVASQGDVIYHTIYKNKSSLLCKEKMDGSGRVMFAFGNATSINVVGDWIYYREDVGGQGTLFKIRTNGLDKTKLTDDNIWNLRVVGDWIYYTATLKYTRDLYRIKNDGTGRQKLYSNIVDSSFNVSEDSVYCNISAPDKIDPKAKHSGVVKMNLDGSNPTIINGCDYEYFCVDGEYAYSTGALNWGRIVKMKLDGTESQDITKERIYRFTLSNGWLYYIPSGLTGVYKCKTDGSEVIKLSDLKANTISVVGDWVYYWTVTSESYRMKIDGTGNEKLD